MLANATAPIIANIIVVGKGFGGDVGPTFGIVGPLLGTVELIGGGGILWEDVGSTFGSIS